MTTNGGARNEILTIYYLFFTKYDPATFQNQSTETKFREFDHGKVLIEEIHFDGIDGSNELFQVEVDQDNVYVVYAKNNILYAKKNLLNIKFKTNNFINCFENYLAAHFRFTNHSVRENNGDFC